MFGIATLRSLRRLGRLMPLRDAVRFHSNPCTELSIFLTPLKRYIALRGQTSDIECFLKIFLNDEYHSPFKVEPRLIIDGGANIGLATLYYSAVYPHAKIYA